MVRIRFLLGAALALSVCGLALAEPVPLVNAQGVIDKVEKDAVVIRPRGPGGKFEKAVTLKVTGTSTFTVVGSRKTKGKMFITQTKAGVRDLEAKQVIAYIYTTAGSTGPTLLSGVVQPADEK